MDKNPKGSCESRSSISQICRGYTEQQVRELLELFTSHVYEDTQLGTSKALVKALKAEGYDIPSNINETDIEELLNNPEELESILLYCYNRNFWNTHIKDGNKLKALRIHKPGDVRQERMDIGKWKHFGSFENMFSKYGRKINKFSKEHFGVGLQDAIDRYYHPHLIEMSPEEENMIENIILGLEKGEKNFIILNHDTFANIPLAILKFMRKAEELGIKDINKHFTTVIGPLLNVHSLQNITLNTLSNIVITHPAGNKIPEAKPLISIQQKGALRQFGKDLGENGEGQIYFCAPSGTRDVVIYGKNEVGNTIPHIYLPDESWGSNISTIKLVNRLKNNNPGLKIYALSTNTTDLKKDISLTDNSWNKGAAISMHITSLNQEDPLDTKEVVQCLAKGVTYPIKGKEDGQILSEKQCATLLPEELFKKLKQWSKIGKYPEGLIKENGELDVGKLNELIKENTLQNSF